MISSVTERARDLVAATFTRPLTGFPSSTRDPFPAGAHPLDWRRSGMSAFVKRVCRSFTEALLADEDEAGQLVPLPEATLDRVIHKLDLWVGTASPELGRGFVALAVALQASPALTIYKPFRFTSLSLKDRLRVLSALEDHDNGLFSMLLTAFKVPLASAAFEEGELLASSGYPRQDLMEPRPTPLRRGGPR